MMNAGVYTLFVYGSLRRGLQNPVYEYISRHFTYRGMARTKGWLMDLGEYPAGVPTADEHFITGELYQAHDAGEFAWAIGQLDDYEGITAEEGEKPLFRRELAEVIFNEQPVQAWAYWYNGDVQDKPRIESGDIMDYKRSH